MLRLSYIDANADTEEELVEERLKWLSRLIKERWREQRGVTGWKSRRVEVGE